MRKLALLLALAAAAGAATLPDSVTIETNIAYGKYPETVLDILRSKNAPAGKRPGVLVIHGGGWINGTKESMVERFCLPYLEKGFVVANVEYRLARAAPAPAAVEDALQAAKWFRDNARRHNVDPKRIVVTGGSAGGHLALMVGMTPKSADLGPSADVAAVVNFYGITDVGEQIEGPNMRQYAARWVPQQTERRLLARRVSPMAYVRKDVPPILTIHGDEDPTVPYEQGVMLTKALLAAGAKAELIPVHRGQHGFPPETMTGLYEQIFDFLRREKILTD